MISNNAIFPYVILLLHKHVKTFVFIEKTKIIDKTT